MTSPGFQFIFDFADPEKVDPETVDARDHAACAMVHAMAAAAHQKQGDLEGATAHYIRAIDAAGQSLAALDLARRRSRYHVTLRSIKGKESNS